MQVRASQRQLQYRQCGLSCGVKVVKSESSNALYVHRRPHTLPFKAKLVPLQCRPPHHTHHELTTRTETCWDVDTLLGFMPLAATARFAPLPRDCSSEVCWAEWICFRAEGHTNHNVTHADSWQMSMVSRSAKSESANGLSTTGQVSLGSAVGIRYERSVI